jgi:hypothetical protein
MGTIRHKLFLGCNYNDKSIKSQFDNIKTRIENDTPMQCVIIDKRTSKAAKDIWLDIQKEITESIMCVYDISGFRPNVILELGYALATKNNEQILLTFKNRKAKGRQPTWLLSDISHLQRYQYGIVSDLEKHIREQIMHTEYMKSFAEFVAKCATDTSAPDNYSTNGLNILKSIRDQGPKTEEQIINLLQGSACRPAKMIQLLKGSKLMKRQQGSHSRFYID